MFACLQLSCQLPLCADIISHSAATADQHMSTTHRAMELTVQCHKLSCEDLVMRRYALPWETSMLDIRRLNKRSVN